VQSLSASKPWLTWTSTPSTPFLQLVLTLLLVAL
jgi:hypothetical protein